MDLGDRPDRPAPGGARAQPPRTPPARERPAPRPRRAPAASGGIANAIEHADAARSIEPWAATPYVQLGLLAELQGDYATAAERLTQAIDREDRNWQLY